MLANLTPSGPVVHNKTLAMEQIGQNYGFILYRTKIPSSMKGPAANISIPGLRDRGIVFVNQVSYINCLQLLSILKEWMGGGGGGVGNGERWYSTCSSAISNAAISLKPLIVRLKVSVCD